jgi:hypothetical protein
VRLLTTIHRTLCRCKNAGLGLIVVVSLLFTPQLSFAGILGFKNETSGTLEIQEVRPGPLVRLGKAIKMIASETFSDTASSGADRRFIITDGKGKVLFDGYVQSPSARENIIYSIKPDGKGGIKLEPTRTLLDDKKK